MIVWQTAGQPDTATGGVCPAGKWRLTVFLLMIVYVSQTTGQPDAATGGVCPAGGSAGAAVSARN